MSEAMNGEAVNRVAELAKEAAGFDIKKVDVEGVGLPKSFYVGFDHKTNGPVDLRPMAEKWRTAPERATGTATVTTLGSFIELTRRHMDNDSAIFAATSWPNPTLTAVFDYHVEESAGLPKARNCSHRAHYAFPITDEFKAWADQDGKPMGQEAFAAFIEEHAPELASPTKEEVKDFGDLFRTEIATPSKLIELSRGLQVNVAGKVKSATTLQSGEGEILFVEEHLNTKGQKLIVPGLFMVAMPAFIDGAPVRIPARLRYRVREGAVVWFYQMFRWKQLLRDRVVADLATVKEATKLPTFEGSPER